MCSRYDHGGEVYLVLMSWRVEGQEWVENRNIQEFSIVLGSGDSFNARTQEAEAGEFL